MAAKSNSMSDFLNSITSGVQNNPIVKGVEQTAGQVVNALTQPKGHAKTNGAISKGPIGQAAGSALAATNPNNGDVYGQAEQQYGPNSPQAYGALVGSALPAIGFDSGAGELTPSVKAATHDATDIVKQHIDETMANAQTQPGGLQAGFVRSPSYTRPSVPAGGAGNGDQFLFPEKPLTGGTPAKVAARPYVPPSESAQFNPGGAMKPPAPESPALPLIGETPKQELPPINTNPIQDTQSASMNPPGDPYARTHPANENSHATPSAQARGITMDKTNVKNAADQKQINATLDGYGITHDSHYNQFQANDRQLGMLSKNVTQHLIDNPGTINKGQLVNDVAHDFMKNDMFSGDELGTAQRVIDSVFKRSASDQMLQTRTVAPDEISGPSGMLMKTRAGDDSAKTFSQPDDTKWTDNQKAARILRDNLDRHIDTKWPAVAKMNNDMSDMISARPTLRDNANTEIKANQSQILNPKAKQGGNVPVGKIVGGTLGSLPLIGAAAVTGKELYDNQAAQSASLTEKNLIPNSANTGGKGQNNEGGKNTIAHNQTISQNPANVNQTDPLQVKPNADGTWNATNIYNMKDANNKSIVMDNQTYKKLSGQITQEMQSNQGNAAALSALQSAQGQLDRTYNGTQKIRDLHDTTTTALQSINDAQTMLKNKAADPSFADMFQIRVGPVDIGAQNLHEGISSDYKALRQQLITVDNAFPQLGLDVQSANSAGAAQKLLAQAAQKIIAYENQNLQNVNGGNTVTNPPPSAVPPGPVANGSTSQNYPPQPSGSIPPQDGPYQFTAPNPMFQTSALPPISH